MHALAWRRSAATPSRPEATDAFRDDTLAKTRARWYARLRTTHPDRIPVVLTAASERAPRLDKCRLLCPDEASVACVLAHIRRHAQHDDGKPLGAAHATFVFDMRGRMLPANVALRDLRSDDGFVSIRYDAECTFG